MVGSYFLFFFFLNNHVGCHYTSYPKVGEGSVLYVDTVDALATEFGVAADASRATLLEPKANAVVILVLSEHLHLHLLLVYHKATQTGED